MHVWMCPCHRCQDAYFPMQEALSAVQIKNDYLNDNPLHIHIHIHTCIIV